MGRREIGRVTGQQFPEPSAQVLKAKRTTRAGRQHIQVDSVHPGGLEDFDGVQTLGERMSGEQRHRGAGRRPANGRYSDITPAPAQEVAARNYGRRRAGLKGPQ